MKIRLIGSRSDAYGRTDMAKQSIVCSHYYTKAPKLKRNLSLVSQFSYFN